MLRFSVKVEGTTQTLQAFLEVQQGLVDLRKLGAWDQVIGTFRKITKQQFATEGAAGGTGKWAPLSPRYAERKLKQYGPVGILTASGKMFQALTTNTGDTYIDKQPMSLEIGVKLPYPKYHQTGTGRMPAREVVSLTDEQKAKITEPLARKIRQLIANAKLAEKRGNN